MRRVTFPEHFAAVHLEDWEYVFEQYALCRKVRKLAQGLLELYLKTALCQYLKDFDDRCEGGIPGLFGGGGWI
jgi:hypothetical protein